MRRIYFRDWFRGQLLLGAFISLFLPTLSVPGQVKAAEGTPVPLSISTISQDYALLSIPFRSDELGLAKRSKNDASAKRASTPHMVSSFWTHGLASPGPRAFSNCASNFDSVFGRDFRQACQLLDTPPPCAMVSF